MTDYSGKRVLLVDGGCQQVLPLIKAFRDLDCDVSVYCGSKLDVGYASRYTHHRILDCLDRERPEETYLGIKKAIEAGQYDLVIPMNDFTACILADHKTELSPYAYICVNDLPIFRQASDKLQTMRICMEEGLPCPRTVLAENVDDLNLDGWKYPLVVKPRTGYGANGFSVVQNKEELKQIFLATQKKFGPALIQEYIPQTGQQYQVEMFMDKDGQCKSFVLMDKLRWYPLDGGPSTINMTVKDEKIKQDCIKLLQRMHWRGYASYDLIRDPRDGEAKILEINPRINGTIKICFYAGVNMALQHLQDAFDEPVTDYPDFKEGLYLRVIHKDILWFIKSKDRFKAKPSWFSWKNTTDEVASIRDIKPFFTYSIEAVKKIKQDKQKRSIK